MTDLGLFNFIKNQLSQGQTKEQISPTLLSAGHSQASIDEAFVAVESGNIPAMISKTGADLSQRPESNNRQMEWDDFRGAFWKNFLLIILVTVIAKIPIPFLGLLVFINIIFVLRIMSAVWDITRAVRGKGSTLLSIVCLFSPPLAYYFVYQMTKKNGWDILLGVFEQIFVTVIGAFFLLWIIQLILVITLLGYAIMGTRTSSTTGSPTTTSSTSAPTSSSPVAVSDQHVYTAGTIKKITDTPQSITILTNDAKLISFPTASTTKITSFESSDNMKDIPFSALKVGNYISGSVLLDAEGNLVLDTIHLLY